MTATYTVATVRKNQPTIRQSVTRDELHSVIRTAFYADGQEVATADHAVIIAAVNDATSMVDSVGFAALSLNDTHVTIRPRALLPV